MPPWSRWPSAPGLALMTSGAWSWGPATGPPVRGPLGESGWGREAHHAEALAEHAVEGGDDPLVDEHGAERVALPLRPAQRPVLRTVGGHSPHGITPQAGLIAGQRADRGVRGELSGVGVDGIVCCGHL